MSIFAKECFGQQEWDWIIGFECLLMWWWDWSCGDTVCGRTLKVTIDGDGDGDGDGNYDDDGDVGVAITISYIFLFLRLLLLLLMLLHNRRGMRRLTRLRYPIWCVHIDTTCTSNGACTGNLLVPQWLACNVGGELFRDAEIAENGGVGVIWFGCRRLMIDELFVINMMRRMRLWRGFYTTMWQCSCSSNYIITQ